MSPAQQGRACLLACLTLLAVPVPRVVAQTASPGIGVLSAGAARLSYDPSTWMVEAGGEPGNWALTNKKGDAYGAFIAQRMQVPESTVVNFALDQLRTKLNAVKILSQETRTIAGAPVRVVRFSSLYQGIAITGQGCFYGGKLGAVQVAAWTGSELFDEYQSDFDQLCAGLEMGQSQGPGTLRSVGPEDKSPTAKDQPPAPPPPAIFILKNGERIESSRYTLTATEVRVEKGDADRTIPVSALNLEATNAANTARGLDLKIPTGNNQMTISF